MLESIVQTPKNNVRIVELKGRLAYGVELQNLKPELAAFAATAQSVLILNLAQVDYVDSSGIGALLYLDGIARDAGASLRIAGANKRVQEALHITHTDKILTMDPDVATSLSRSNP
jgi:anti-sigma B factor antagonist